MIHLMVKLQHAHDLGIRVAHADTAKAPSGSVEGTSVQLHSAQVQSKKRGVPTALLDMTLNEFKWGAGHARGEEDTEGM